MELIMLPEVLPCVPLIESADDKKRIVKKGSISLLPNKGKTAKAHWIIFKCIVWSVFNIGPGTPSLKRQEKNDLSDKEEKRN